MGFTLRYAMLSDLRQTDRQTDIPNRGREGDRNRNRTEQLTAHTPTTAHTRDTPRPPTARATPHRAARSSYALTLSSIPTRRH